MSEDSVYDRLLAAIRSGEYGPGARMREIELAERLGLSRTPVREALRRLEAERIVEHRPRLGAVVRRLSHSEVVELYEMRVIFERTAAEMAAQHATAAEIDELEALNADLSRAATPPEAAQLNGAFHRCLYRAARNRFLLDAADGLGHALMLLGPTTLEGEARVSEVAQQHGAIIAALRERDRPRAGLAAAAHIETSLRHRLKGLRG